MNNNFIHKEWLAYDLIKFYCRKPKYYALVDFKIYQMKIFNNNDIAQMTHEIGSEKEAKELFKNYLENL